MNTFWVFALIFIPFGWYLIRGLRFTDQTIGQSSPLHTVVQYRLTARQHFTQGWLIVWVLISLTLLPLPFILIANLKTATSLWHYALTLATVAVTGWYGYQLYRLIQLHSRYWLLSKGVVLTFDPGTKTIHVDYNGQQTDLNAATVERIEHHVADPTGPKLFRGYGYYRFFDSDGQVTVVNDIPSLLYFTMDDYFRATPQDWYSHSLPWPPVSPPTAVFLNFAN